MTNFDWTLFLLLAAFGGSVGSFMNVVIYRLPAGLSIVRPASRCPNCEHPIRAYHNLPVVGWILLRGKCYDCGQRISARYPLVEAVVAILFVATAAAIFVRGGEPPIAWNDLRRWIIYGSTVTGLCSLICIGLIQLDGKRVPRVLFVPLLASGVVGGVAMWLANSA